MLADIFVLPFGNSHSALLMTSPFLTMLNRAYYLAKLVCMFCCDTNLQLGDYKVWYGTV